MYTAQILFRCLFKIVDAGRISVKRQIHFHYADYGNEGYGNVMYFRITVMLD